MSQISNVNGIVAIEGGEAVGYCGVVEIGRLPLPLRQDDAEMMIRICLHRNDDFESSIGVTATMFIRDLTKDLLRKSETSH